MDRARYQDLFGKLVQLLAQADQMPDFHHGPYVFEYALNRLFVVVRGARRFAEGLHMLQALGDDIPPQYQSELFMVELYMLLSVCKQLSGDWEGAVQSMAHGEICGNRSSALSRYEHIMVSLCINKVFLYYQFKQFHSAVQEGVLLYDYQFAHEKLYRLHFICLLTAYCTYWMGDEHSALDWFKRGIYIVLTKITQSFYLIARYPEFALLLVHPKMPLTMVSELARLYPPRTDVTADFWNAAAD